GLSVDSSKLLMIGMEMFEADQQILIDEYVEDHISQTSFESEARLWNNYKTDYMPIVEFAKESEIPLIATNIPRRYASAVYNNGLTALDSLSNSAKQWIAPLPLEVDTTLKSYQAMSQMAHGHSGANLIYSQAVKDATIAHFILSNLEENSRMIHLNGAYHSNDFEGIVWYIKQADENPDILTINTVSADDIYNIEHEQLQSADITLAVPSTMTTTY
ncbi:MAG: ChaN family lipoprotein, partial [Balneolaceae bacterium]|nr:ChaN family lipoprotein [Balneolaceae bacterium]